MKKLMTWFSKIQWYIARENWQSAEVSKKKRIEIQPNNYPYSHENRNGARGRKKVLPWLS